MAPEPSLKSPRMFTSSALDAANLDLLNQYERALIENPFDYYSHVAFISILHQGLENVTNAADGALGTPSSYDLLPVLREAYDAMDSKYTLGERLWEFRINDEKTLAGSVEERMAVLELCQKATREEPYSAKLWALFGSYIGHLITCVWDPNAPEQWSDEDKLIGKEVFTTDMLIDAWERGAESVKHDVANSSLVWDPYLQLLQDDLERQYTPDKARRVAAIFGDRLNQPHATWDSTFSTFSTFNSRYNQANYEAIMEHTISQNAHIKKTYSFRDEFEFNIQSAINAGDANAEYFEFKRYLKWEKKTIGVSSFNLVNGVYERVHVRFPVDPTLWEDHVEFLLWQKNSSVSILEVLERATRHCPWSGSLWSHRILTLEAENKSHEEIEHVKHSATKTGMLEHTDLEELMKVQIAWCGYLRRKAFDDPTATEDDVDIAEIGIRSALELAHETGIKKLGKDWNGDPQYRLERIHIKFLIQRNSVEEARHIWDQLVKNQQDSYDFWYRYYIFEMVVWANHAVRDKHNAGQQLLTPEPATAVLERGMKRLQTIDHPEPLIEMYVNHCEQHESVLKVRNAVIERRRSERIVSIRRGRERAAAEAAAAQNNHAEDGSGKRKREDEADPTYSDLKRAKADAGEAPTVAASIEEAEPARLVSEAPSTLSTKQKRDREHALIIVRNLPSDVTQTRLRQFFTDCGTVRSIVLKPEQDTATATVEFEAPEEAGYALMKQAKGFDGHDISITQGGSTTLYVTNYPAHADEAYVRKLFSPHGQIIEVRFPSLRYDAHRRFCYVQFASAGEAQAASKALDGAEVEDLKLSAKISDPSAKKKREGATEEGREVYVRHFKFNFKEADIRDWFAKFGTIESIHLPTLTAGPKKGNNKGFCFVVFPSKAEAEAAVAEMHGKDIEGFKLHCEIAKTKEQAKPKYRTELHNSGSPEVREPTPGQANVETSQTAYAPVAERSIALLNVPDTVTDARLGTLVEPYGFKKITLLPQHSGAIVEFHEPAGVGKASLALEGYEIAEGRKIRVGTVAELKKMKAERKPSSGFLAPPRVNRPTPRGGTLLRGRGRPGLGHRAAAPKANENGKDGEKKEVKSNEEFRAMLLGGKKEKAEAKSGDTEMKEGNGDA
jgi:RNA recognition motif-containing protein